MADIEIFFNQFGSQLIQCERHIGWIDVTGIWRSNYSTRINVYYIWETIMGYYKLKVTV